MSSKTKVALLYICTGKYVMFWDKFFSSAEKYLLVESQIEKHYLVFTDAEVVSFSENERVHVYEQEQRPWPYITLDRFMIFKKAYPLLMEMDYIYFFNGNMLFVDSVNEELLPTKEQPLVFVQHPGFYNRTRREYTYERNQRSTACISDTEGEYYFMGGLNGGLRDAYLTMVTELCRRIEVDKSNNVIAIWHDESHLNRYAIDYSSTIKILNPQYGYPEGWDLPFDPKIVIRDKTKYGGHDYLRDIQKGFFQRIKHFIQW